MVTNITNGAIPDEHPIKDQSLSADCWTHAHSSTDRNAIFEVNCGHHVESPRSLDL